MENYTQYLVIIYNENKSEKEYIYIYVYIYNWIILLYSWNQHNIVNELYFNFLNGLKKEAYIYANYVFWLKADLYFQVWLHH